MNFKVLFVSICLSVLMLGCSGDNKSSSGSNNPPGGGGGGGGGGSTTQDPSPLRVEVRYSLDGSSSKTLVGTCKMEADDPIGTFRTCNIQVAELILYYSKLEFTVSTDSRTRCTQVAFTPYWYRKSSSPTFSKDGEADSEIDCSTGLEADCFGGAAPNMVEGFPFNVGLFYLTVNKLSSSYTLASTYSRSQEDKDRSMATNANVANNLPIGNRAAAISSPMVRYMGGNNYNDYKFMCFDDWANIKYQFTLTIGDDDEVDIPSQTPLDYFWDWGQ